MLGLGAVVLERSLMSDGFVCLGKLYWPLSECEMYML
jgi:hypothetical protein